MNRSVLVFALLPLLYCCGYDNAGPFSRDDIPGTEMIPNADIRLLSDNYFRQHYTITESIVIEGYVTANDLSGNYFKSFTIEDGTAAIEVCAGITDLHNYYQMGRRVVVDARGLVLGSYNGVIQLGRRINPYSDYRVEDFGSRGILESFVHRDTHFRLVAPRGMEIGEMTEQDCGILVRIGKVLADDAQAGNLWAEPSVSGGRPSTGYRKFRDISGDSLTVVTSGYANFAKDPVPGDSVYLTGILQYGKLGGSRDHFGLKLRDIYDVVR